MYSAFLIGSTLNATDLRLRATLHDPAAGISTLQTSDFTPPANITPFPVIAADNVRNSQGDVLTHHETLAHGQMRVPEPGGFAILGNRPCKIPDDAPAQAVILDVCRNSLRFRQCYMLLRTLGEENLSAGVAEGSRAPASTNSLA